MKKSGFWTEFRQFIAKGNVMNLAVGVIIGAAFQAITTSLVNDIISPVIGLFASADMSDWSVAVGGAAGEDEWRQMCALADYELPHYEDWLRLE